MRLLKLAAVPLLLVGGALGVARYQPAPPTASFAAAPAAEAQATAEPQAPARPASPEFAPPAPSAPAPLTPAVSELRADLTQLLTTANRGAQVGVLVVSLERGDTLFSFNPDVPLAPASNMKLYSTAAALYYLGPEFRYSTYVLGTGELVDGVLEGDLILYGTGDPTMSGRMLGGSVAPLRALADTLRARGVREVRGDIVGDGSYFDAEWLGRGWSPDNFAAWYSAPVGALSISENVASVRVLPGAAPGTPARITTTPATEGLAIVNRTTTVPSGQTAIRFDYEPGGLVVSGRIAHNHPGIARSMPIVDPTNFTAAVFRRVLEEQGIQVRGGVRTIHHADHSPVTLANHSARNGNPQPHPRVLAIHLSPNMAEMVSVTNHVSHNLFAEALLKTVGRVALGDGSFEGGARAIRYFLECEAGIDSAAVAIVDGSGLSPLNRVSARATIQLLDLMTRNEHWEPFLSSLPEAGHRRPRGLQRMHGSAAERNLRAKTGTIRNVSSLSGYVRSADGELLAFSILANNLPASSWGQKRLEDQIGVRLAEFQRPPAFATAAEPLLPEPGRAVDAEVAETPPADEPQPAAPAERSAPREERSHTVRAGDTLDGIARQHGTTVRAIEAANPGIDPRRIRPGQSIRLPN